VYMSRGAAPRNNLRLEARLLRISSTTCLRKT
jgi:hypothetical protein